MTRAEHAVRRMLRAMAHRGPNSEAQLVRAGAVMASNRLAIRGIDRVQPPLIEHESGVIVACNGEIDNHRELRKMLATHGHAVALSTDVAVIAPLYLQEGLRFIDHLDGVFALALWDPQRNRLVLARDRGGERHLYYTVTKDRLTFASELAAMLVPRSTPPRLDAQAVRQFLHAGYCASPHSPVHGVRKLTPGELFVFEPEGYVQHRRYWRLPARPAATIPPSVRTFDDTFRGAVARQTDVDVDYGVLLSGGVDSALVAAVARTVKPRRPLPAYCIRFAEASYDEGGPAARVARDLGCEFVPVTIAAEHVPGTLRALVRGTGELLADPAWIPMSLVAKRAAQDVRMLLSGEGADELFGGYPTYLGARWAGIYTRLPRPMRSASARLVEALPPSDKKMPVSFLLKRFVRGNDLDVIARHHLWASTVSPEWLRRLGLEPPRDSGQPGADRPVDAVQRDDFEHLLPDSLMAKSDRGGMLHAVEVRTPFLDQKVIEFAAALPLGARIRRLTTKPFLKRYASTYLPRAIVNRRKRGLSVPLAAWLRGPLQAWAWTRLQHPSLATAGIRTAAAQQLMAEHLRRRADHARDLGTDCPERMAGMAARYARSRRNRDARTSGSRAQRYREGESRDPICRATQERGEVTHFLRHNPVRRHYAIPRLSIIERYILRQFLVDSLAAVVVLLVIFAGSAFADAVNDVATGRLPGGVMFTVLGLNLIKSLQALLPMAMFLGMLLALGRLYRDNEMQVLAASGLGPKGLLVPAAIFAFGVAIMVGLASLWLAPWSARTADATIERADRSVLAAGLEPGRFTDLPGRNAVLFANAISPDGTHLRNVFVEAEHTGRNSMVEITVVTAARGSLHHGSPGSNRFMVLRDGHRYENPLGRSDWRLMQFKRSNIALSPPADRSIRDDPENRRSTMSLIGDPKPAARAELQWRIAMPFGALVLAMLALPLARQRPRASPVGRLLIAVLAYLVIMNLMALARSFIASGKLAASVGLWWVLLPVFIGAAGAFAHQYVTRQPHSAVRTFA